jgi:hypothetical protein
MTPAELAAMYRGLPRPGGGAARLAFSVALNTHFRATGKSQRDLARQVGIHVTVLSHYTRLSHLPTDWQSAFADDRLSLKAMKVLESLGPDDIRTWAAVLRLRAGTMSSLSFERVGRALRADPNLSLDIALRELKEQPFDMPLRAEVPAAVELREKAQPAASRLSKQEDLEGLTGRIIALAGELDSPDLVKRPTYQRAIILARLHVLAPRVERAVRELAR